MSMNRRAAACLAVAFAIMALARPIAADQAIPPQRFTVESDGHPLAVWARVPEMPRGAVVLLHGRTWSSRPAFDLQVPGLQRSVLQSLADQGFAAYALDARGYGATPRDSTGWLTPARAADDAAAVLKWVAARHPSLAKPALVGWSLGGSIAHLTAMMSPSLLSALVFYGYAPDPQTIVEPLDAIERPLRLKNTRDAATADFLSPKVTPRKVIRAFVETALKTDPILVDWRNDEEFAYDSSRIMTPTLVIYGERDPSIDPPTAKYFFSAIDTANKELIAIPRGDHCAHLEDTHDAWVAAIAGFLSRSARGR
jgi:pimeloyl-ACP methyl ester carboxylesterase